VPVGELVSVTLDDILSAVGRPTVDHHVFEPKHVLVDNALQTLIDKINSVVACGYYRDQRPVSHERYELQRQRGDEKIGDESSPQRA